MRSCHLIALIPALLAFACGEEPDYLTLDELMDPEACKDCHPNHYREWSGSMHAYAADDPVFLAMNARGQRETGGELGDFCVNCHAPMAVRTGATTDGLNLAELPQHLKGVTCYFCHSVAAVEGEHNNPLVLADDQVLRGGIDDPVKNQAHRAGYSPLLDRNRQESSTMCGACHDIVLPSGVHLERTFLEWRESLFASEDPRKHLSCGKCHMVGDRPGVIADVPGVPLRYPHEHTFPGVDVALTPWPEMEAQRAGIERDLFGAILPKLCVSPVAGTQVEYTLDNVFAGHMLPSGSAQDRRLWAEIVAYSGDAVVYQSGVVAEGEPVTALADPDLWLLRDITYDENDEPAHMFWDVARVDSQLLPPAVTNDPADPAYYHSVTRTYTITDVVPDRITARVHIRPMGLDVLDDLITSGDLDPTVRDAVPTFTLTGTVLEWTQADGYGCVTR